jgi:hypothetical protein
MINVVIRSHCRLSLSAHAKFFRASCWTSEFSKDGWVWEFEVADEESANQFVAGLPDECSVEIQNIPDD